MLKSNRKQKKVFRSWKETITDQYWWLPVLPCCFFLPCIVKPSHFAGLVLQKWVNGSIYLLEKSEIGQILLTSEGTDVSEDVSLKKQVQSWLQHKE